jgi:hypothetical protein
MENGNTGKATLAPPQATVSQEVLNVLDRLASAAEKVACRAADKLHPICQSSCPTPDGCDTVAREYPPLFSEMRERLETIENSIDRMNNVLDRAEV